MTTIDLTKILSEQQLLLESLKAIGQRDDGPLGNLFRAEKPILK
jgi:hypothetical protein